MNLRVIEVRSNHQIYDCRSHIVATKTVFGTELCAYKKWGAFEMHDPGAYSRSRPFEGIGITKAGFDTCFGEANGPYIIKINPVGLLGRKP